MYHNINGLVLRSSVVSEADKLLTIYTYKWGKVLAVAPGAKKIMAKLASATEPVTESEFSFYSLPSSSRVKIVGAKTSNSFPCLLKSWRNFGIAQYCAEICDKLTPFKSENSLKYDLLLRTWQYLETASNPWRIFSAFTLRFLKLSGYNFLEYLKRESSSIKPYEKSIIFKMACSSGKDLDESLQVDPVIENNIVKYISSYLNLYLPAPLESRKYFQKIEIAQKKLVCQFNNAVV